ncbi:MAG: hypothetical protein KAG61_12650, partial [Bacteriovoracaceae bacterium]|nr:hypothetical protein [Bacteriovoracaceae bacterium]
MNSLKYTLILVLCCWLNLSFSNDEAPGRVDSELQFPPDKKSSPVYASAGDISKEISISPINHYPHDFMNYVDGLVLDKGGVSVIKSSGLLSKGFSIELPQNKYGVNALNFNYSSRNAANIGFGTGISYSIEKMTITNNGTAYSGNSSYMLQKHKVEFGKKRLKQQLSKVNIFNINFLESFRATKIESSDIFYLISSDKGQYYTRLGLNGNTSVFTLNGELLYKVDMFGNYLHYSWSEGALLSIDDGKNDLLFIQYSQDRQMISSHMYGKLSLLPQRVNAIITANRKYVFTYEDNYLLKVDLAGSLKSIFDVSYHRIEKKLVRNKRVQLNDGEVLINRANGDTENIKLSSNNTVFYTDINGDLIDDKIIMKSNNLSGGITSAYKNVRYETDDATFRVKLITTMSEFKRSLEKIEIPFSFFIQNKEGVFVENTELKLSLAAKELFTFHITSSTKYISGQKYPYYKVSVENKFSLQFVDYNSDGHRDLILCPRDKNDYGLTKVYRGRKEVQQNPLVVSIYNLQQGVQSRVFNNSSFRKGVVFTSNGISYTRENYDFKCGQYSLFSDFNQDGALDILSGSEIYSFGKSSVSKTILNKKQIKTLFYPIKSNPQNENSYMQFYLIDSKHQALPFHSSIIDLKTRRMKLIGTFYSYDVEHYGIGKTLNRVNTTWGGYVTPTFSLRASGPVVSNISYFNENGKSLKEERFEYFNPLWGPSFGIFMGYEKVKHFESARNIFSSESINFFYDRRAIKHKLENINRYTPRAQTTTLFKGNDAKLKVESKLDVVTIQGKTFLRNISIKKSNYDLYSESLVHRMMSFGPGSLLETSTTTTTKGSKTGKKEVTYTYDFEKYLLLNKQITSKGATYSDSLVVEYDRGKMTEQNDGVFNYKYILDRFGRTVESFKNDMMMSRVEFNIDNRIIITGADNRWTDYQLDKFGNTVWSKNDKGVENKFTYFSDSHRKERVRDGVLVSKIKVSKLNNIAIFNEGSMTLKSLSNFGNIQRVETVMPKRAISVLSEFDVDFDGRIHKSYLPRYKNKKITLKKATRLTYDNHGRVVESKSRRSRSATSYSKGCSSTLNENGLIRKICKDIDGKITSSSYLDEEVSVDYDINGRLTSVSDYSFLYDDIGNLKNVLDGDRVVFSSKVEVNKDGETTYAVNGFYQSKYDLQGRETSFTSDEYSFFNVYASGHRSEVHETMFGDENKITFGHDKYDRLTNIDSDSISATLAYDHFGNLTKESYSNGPKLSYSYDRNFVTAIDDHINEIEYRADGKIEQIKYNNGSVSLTKSLNGDDSGYRYSFDDERFHLFYMTENKSRITSIKSNYTDSKEVRYKKHLPVLPESNREKNYTFKSSKGIVTSISSTRGSIKLAYNGMLETIGVQSGSRLFKKLDESSYLINNIMVKKIVVAGTIVGVTVAQDFYIPLLNHQGAIVGLLNEEGERVLLRNYDLSGKLISEKTTEGNENLAEIMLFGYGQLLHIPFMDRKSSLYLSKTRILDATRGYWLTSDTLIVKNPMYLVNNPGNWNLTKYVSGDPVNFVDP